MTENGQSESAICLYNADIYTGFTHITDGFVLIRDGFIENVYSTARLDRYTKGSDYRMIDCGGAMIAPGFFDTHIHGIHGFGTEDADPSAILEMAAHLPAYGVTSFIPTLATLGKEHSLRALKAIREAMAIQEEEGVQGARIAGIHMEGPFISEKKKGIHDPSFIRDVDTALLKEYWQASGGSIRAMTVAPELKGMREFASEAQKYGIVLLAGHSNASYEQMVEGIEAGILHATHFFNAMRSMHHRDPGVVGAILIHPEISCELISDGIHVHPSLVEFLVKEKPAGKIVLVTDSLKPTGLDPHGVYDVKGDNVQLENGVFCRVEDGTIAGSALTMDRGIRQMLSYGMSRSEVIPMACLNPARIYEADDLIGSLLPGRNADLVICSREIEVSRTMIGGKFVFDRESRA